MRCSSCEGDNPEGVRFCEDCGARLILTCPSCNAEVAAGKKFCGACGAALTPAGRRFTSPDAYTPKHLAEKILTSRTALEGERKQVTVLFADLKGSMELLADRDPEEARAILDPVLDRMMEAVHHYEGTVNQVMGDGIMALFGAPVAHEDHAVRACYAALRMQDSIRALAEEARRRHGIFPEIRVGLNSGEVVVRSIGSDLRMDYTAVGQTTHLAARMEQVAAAGSVLISAGTLGLADGYVQVRALGPVSVKGLGDAVETYELTGATTGKSRLQVLAARGLTRFVGRHVELELLSRALARASHAQGQIVALVGEPGVGKSRLCYEFTHSPRTEGWLLLESGSVSYGKATPYLPLIDLFRAYFHVRDLDDARRVRESVSGTLWTLDQALLPALPALLGVPSDEPDWRAMDPQHRRNRSRRVQARPPQGESPPAARPRVRGPPLGGFRDQDVPRRSRRERAHRAGAPARELSTGVPARVGQQDVLHPGPHRSAAAGERGGAAGRPPRTGPGARDREAARHREDRGEPVLSRGMHLDAGRDESARRRARRLPAPNP